MAKRMEKRLPVTDQTHERITRFRDGARMTYDTVINLLLDIVVGEGDERAIAAKLSYEIQTGQRSQPTGSEEEDKPSRRSRTKRKAA